MSQIAEKLMLAMTERSEHTVHYTSQLAVHRAAYLQISQSAHAEPFPQLQVLTMSM